MITIIAEVPPGESVERAFEETIRISKILNCKVRFIFNDLECISHPNGSSTKGRDNYLLACKNKSDTVYSI
ncbi:MAG: hypothetical protein K0R36_562 [Chryseobacterium sp.]|jgi:hypothetical protein|nr:hypothetical protein [Chryseobacterium sp.]